MTELDRDQVEERLRKLPRRAVVAFAARCARRIQPEFKHGWSDAPDKHVRAVADAIDIAERAAIEEVNTLDTRNAVAAAEDATNAAHYGYAYALANTAAIPATGATLAAKAAFAKNVAAVAAQAAAHNADSFDFPIHPEYANSLLRDLSHLESIATTEGWTVQTKDISVPPEVFGPMWPDGPPEGWPAEEVSGDDEIELDIQIPDGMSEDEADKYVAEIVLQMNELHRELGGDGVEISSVDVRAPEYAEVPS